MKIKFSKGIQAPDVVDGMKVVYAPAKRLISRWRWFLIILVAATPLLLILYRVIITTVLVKTPGTVYLKKINIVAPITGNLLAMYTRAGAIVHKGTPLALLGDPVLDDKRQLAKRELESARLFGEETSEKTLFLAQTIEKKLANNLIILRKLLHSGAATISEVTMAEARHDAALNDLLRARENLEVHRSQFLRQLKELELIEGMREKLSIVSPTNGQVLLANIAPETTFIQGTTLLTIASFDEFSIIAYVQEKDVFQILLRDTAVVNFTSDDSFTCHISIYPPTAEHPLIRDELNRTLIPLILTPTEEISNKFYIEGLPCSVNFGMRVPGKNFLW